MALTESVKSFQVPATPGTSAWPPSLPSVPTSRATRVTSEAKERSWSTMVLMASFSCRISPRTSTVIFLDRSPLATAMVTSARLRTWAVRLLAMELTLSVKSFHTPVTSRTWAWPPSLPSVPTSRATRVTSEVNTLSCLIMVLTMVAERRNSPFSGRPSTSRLTVCSRSPLATAAMARVTSAVGQSRSSIRVLTEASISPQAPLLRPSLTRWRVLPCLPTTSPTRSSCWAMRSLVEMISLKVSAILPARPVWLPGSRVGEIPRLHRPKALEQFFHGDIDGGGGGGGVKRFGGKKIAAIGHAVGCLGGLEILPHVLIPFPCRAAGAKKVNQNKSLSPARCGERPSPHQPSKIRPQSRRYSAQRFSDDLVPVGNAAFDFHHPQ